MPSGGRLRLAARRAAFDEAAVRLHPWARVGSFAEIDVADTGAGMDERTAARAFEPFFTTKEDGTGLGLSTVYGIVQQHGGFLHLESAPGRGTRVRICLPLASPEAPRTPAPAAPPDPCGPDEGKAFAHETVLVAEDEPAIRALVTVALTERGYIVVAVRDGEEAVREFSRRPREIAAVVLDVIMPRMSAPEAYEKMRAIRADVKALFITGYAPHAARLAELFERERVAVLEKPFAPHVLAEAVRKLIDRTA
jgi:CheY-like chemotaxis protein